MGFESMNSFSKKSNKENLENNKAKKVETFEKSSKIKIEELEDVSEINFSLDGWDSEVNVGKPEKIEISKEVIENGVELLKSLENKFGYKINRARLDLVATPEGEVKMFEVNGKNPLGFVLNWEFLNAQLKETEDEKAKEELKKEINRIEEVVSKLFGDKIPVFMTYKKDSGKYETPEEKRAFEDILSRKNGTSEFIEEEWDKAIEKYVGDEKYLVWGASVQDDQELAEALEGKNTDNLYGALPFIDNKSFLTKDIVGDNDLLINSESITVEGDFSPLPGNVAKVTEGPKSFGGKGIFFGKNKEAVGAETGEKYLIQEQISKNGTEFDLYLIRIGEDEWEKVAFRRIAAEGKDQANVSQGGKYKVLIPEIKE